MKQRILELQITDEERREWEQIAAIAGERESGWLRARLIEAAKRAVQQAEEQDFQDGQTGPA